MTLSQILGDVLGIALVLGVAYLWFHNIAGLWKNGQQPRVTTGSFVQRFWRDALSLIAVAIALAGGALLAGFDGRTTFKVAIALTLIAVAIQSWLARHRPAALVKEADPLSNPVHEVAPNEPRTAPAVVKTKWWGIRFYKLARRIVVTVQGVSVTCAALLVCFAVFSEFHNRNTITIGTVSVPQTLQARGYTSDVVARKIGDACRRVTTDAQTSMRRIALSVPDPSKQILVPTDSASVYSILMGTIRFLHISHPREISGEVTCDASGQLSLVLRLDGEAISTEGLGPKETLEELLEPAAVAILRHVQPFVVAAWLNRREPEKGELAALELTSLLPEADPNCIFAHNLLGTIFQNRGDTDLAIQEYQTAMRLDPRFANPHNNLGRIYDRLGQTDRAIKEYQAAIQIDPDFAVAHYNMAIAYKASGQVERAVQEYQTAVRLDPKDVDSHINLGSIYEASGQRDRAFREYQIATLVGPRDAVAHNNLGSICHDLGQKDRAIKEYQTALELNPKLAVAHFNLATSLIELANSVADGAQKQLRLIEACSHAVAAATFEPSEREYSTLVQTLNGRVPCKVEPR